MDLTQITTLLALSLAVRGDYSGSSSYSAPPSSSYGAPSSSYNAPSTNYGAPVPSTSYGAPSYDHGDHHGPVKRHVRGGGCCQSSGGWYNGGSSGVRPGQHSSGGCCSQNPRPPSPCGHQGCGASQPQPQTYAYPQPQPQTYAHPQPQPQTYAHPQPQPQTYAHPHPQPQTYAHPQHQPQTYAHPQPQPQTYAPPQPQRYSPPPQPQHSPSPAPSYHQPSPRISQPPPYPLPSGPPGGQHAPGRPDYLPRYAGGYGGYGLSTRPYNFGYNVRDYHTGADFKQQETSDGNTVKGQYRVQLPDGRTQIVTYTADWQTGFHADVQYEGEASYPAVYGTGGSFPPSTASSYGVPSQPSSSYGVPSHSSSSWNSQPSGGSYQSRVGGTGNQYLNIGHAPAGGASHGHPGYRK